MLIIEGTGPNNGPKLKIYMDDKFIVFEEESSTSFIPYEPHTPQRIDMRQEKDSELIMFWGGDKKWWVFPKGTFQAIIKKVHGIDYKFQRMETDLLNIN
jgi:hypothetical protein